jgi:hypothetical protein
MRRLGTRSLALGATLLGVGCGQVLGVSDYPVRAGTTTVVTFNYPQFF